MNNYINVRVQAHNHNKTFNSIKHNLRKISSQSQAQNGNTNFLIMEGNTMAINNKMMIDMSYELLSKAYQEDRAIHNEIYKKYNKRNLREIKSTWCEGVFTFSDQLKVDLQNGDITPEQLINCANDCLKEITSTYNTKINYMVLHLDEVSPHFHWSFSNYDNEGKSLFFANKNKEFLSNLQDIGAKHFSRLGMKRGQSKDITNSNHIDINKWWRNQNIIAKQQMEENQQKTQELIKQQEISKNTIVNQLQSFFELNNIYTTNEILDNIAKEYSELIDFLKINGLYDEKMINDFKKYQNGLLNDIFRQSLELDKKQIIEIEDKSNLHRQ